MKIECIEIKNTECNKCCYIHCGMDVDKEKGCHYDNQEGFNCAAIVNIRIYVSRSIISTKSP